MTQLRLAAELLAVPEGCSDYSQRGSQGSPFLTVPVRLVRQTASNLEASQLLFGKLPCQARSLRLGAFVWHTLATNISLKHCCLKPWRLLHFIDTHWLPTSDSMPWDNCQRFVPDTVWHRAETEFKRPAY